MVCCCFFFTKLTADFFGFSLNLLGKFYNNRTSWLEKSGLGLGLFICQNRWIRTMLLKNEKKNSKLLLSYKQIIDNLVTYFYT